MGRARRWRCSPAGIGFAVVYGVLFEHPTPSEPFARVAFTLLILLLMVWSGRRHHLSRSASEQPFGPSIGGHAHIRPAAESSFCSSVASAILHPVRRSAARDSLPLGADHTVDVSTDVEQALLELRQLQVSGAVRGFLAGQARGADIAVLDPPRAGAGRAVIDLLASAGVPRVIHIGCEAAAFARDIGLYRGHGYRVQDIRVFDAFPLTHHVECLALLSR